MLPSETVLKASHCSLLYGHERVHGGTMIGLQWTFSPHFSPSLP